MYLLSINLFKLSIYMQTGNIEEKLQADVVSIWENKLFSEKDSIRIDTIPQPPSFGDEISNSIGIFSEKTASLIRKLRKLEDFPEIPVLIEGETGTGKEVFARYIHLMNGEVSGEFVALNCTLFTNDLFSAELFGYEKGSFTGADQKGRTGKIESAKNGTLFLDEITETTPDFQAKLLRLIQEREYYKVGGNAVQRASCRIVCASNRGISDMVNERLFREDLYYRLSVCHIVIPPLRERNEEIVPFCLMFIKKLSSLFPRAIRFIEPEALRVLKQYDWPGNIREMENLLKNCIIFGSGDTITAEDIRTKMNQAVRHHKDYAVFDPTDFILPDEPFNLEELNMEIVRKTLEKFSGNKSTAAKYLSLSRSQLYDRYRL